MIKNLEELSVTPERRNLLEILNYGLEQSQAGVVLRSALKLKDDKLYIEDKVFNLKDYKRIFVLGIGKASGAACKVLETLFGDKIKLGFCIDVQERDFNIITLTVGSHPHASEKNVSFTQNAIASLSDLNKNDLLISVISGGGSSLFCAPFETECIAGVEIFKELTKKGANIEEINTVRKHLSSVKGGGLAKTVYPATVVSLLFSDVPGNNISMIASGPTVKDITTIQDAKNILKEYDVNYKGELFETPKEDKYFENVFNFLICSNKTTINAMMEKAQELGVFAKALGEDIQMNANDAGKFLLKNTKPGEILLSGGETTVKIRGAGKGGRNQHTALAALEYLEDGDVVISCASDGYDYTEAAGAIADQTTSKKVEELGLDIKKYLENDDSFNFFEQTKDQIMTGKTGLNVSDIFLTYKKNN